MKLLRLLATLILAGFTSAATVSWENLQGLVLDRQVLVRTADGVPTRAVVCGINDREIILLRANGEAVTIPRERVERVQLWSRGTGATKGLLWGAAIGAVVYGIGALVYLANEGTGEEAGGIAGIFAAGTTMFAGAGGGIGAAVGGVSTVYQAPKAMDVKSKNRLVAPILQTKPPTVFSQLARWSLARSIPESVGTSPTLPPYLDAHPESR